MPQLPEVDCEQERLLKEYIPGRTVDRYVLSGEMKPEFFDQIPAMCRILYAAGLNIDYWPTNFVVMEDRLYYVDYECNSYMAQWDFEHRGSKYWETSQDFLNAFTK